MRRIVAVLGVAAALVVALASPAAAKSFRLDGLTVEATVNSDATMDVAEHVTYHFEGSFHRATRTIPAGDYRIENLKVSEGGVPLTVEGTPNDFAWTFSATDTNRTFDISYRVVGAVKVGTDAGELYWKWIGTDHPGVGSVVVDLRTPADEGIRAWAHGPLNGIVEIAGRNVSFSVAPLPPATFVEGRVAIPAAAFAPSVPRTAARLPRILAEEKTSADQANAQRDAARKQERDRRRNARVAVPIAAVFALAGWAVFLAVWRRWGKEPARPADVGEYFRDVPAETPAVVEGVLDFGDVGPTAFSATVVDLAQRGYLDITEERHDRFLLADKLDWAFTRKKAPGDDLKPYEHMLLDRLFAEGDSSSQSALVSWAKAHATEAERFWDAFRDGVKADVRATYLEGARAKPYAINIVTAVAVVGAGVVTFVVGSGVEGGYAPALVVGAVAALSGVLQILATRTLRRRTELGARRAAEWGALRHFLEDFSSLNEAPVASMAIWERYLVYAVALGVSEQLVRGLALRVPEVAQNTSFAPWYVGGMANGSSRFGSFASFGPDFGAAAASAFTPSSSASGSGGGFSSGGGGGGGGGGFGAS